MKEARFLDNTEEEEIERKGRSCLELCQIAKNLCRPTTLREEGKREGEKVERKNSP